MAKTYWMNGLEEAGASNDTVAGPVWLQQIVAVIGTDAGPVTVMCGGTAGVTLYSGTPATSQTTTLLNLARPINVTDLVVTALPANAKIEFIYAV